MNSIEDKSERILAIDYGDKRIGIAVSDPLKMFAIPLVTILNDNSFWKNFKKILEKYNIIKIIIGFPYKEDGLESSISEKIINFNKKIIKDFRITTEFVDERYSSVLAWEQILESVPSRKKRRDKSLIDKNAAAVILGEYLNKQG